MRASITFHQFRKTINLGTVLGSLLLAVVMVAVLGWTLKLDFARAAGPTHERYSPDSLAQQSLNPSSQSDKPLRGANIVPSDTLTIALSADVSGLDPGLETDPNSFLVTAQIYETLVNVGNIAAGPNPALADSWQVSPDGLTWTFNLRAGTLFHDGSNLDAAAVLFNFERWWDPAHPNHIGSFEYFEYIFGGLKGEPGTVIAGLGTNGSNEFQITLTRPDSRLLVWLTMPPFAIASPMAIQAGTLVSTPVGSGPFQFLSWVSGDSIQLAANPTYQPNPPEINQLTFAVFPDDNTRFTALQNNTIQLALDLSPDFLLAASMDPNVNAVIRSPHNTGYLGMNRAHPALSNPLVRQAIAHAINKPAIVANTYGPVDQVARYLLPPGIGGTNDPNIVDYAYDPVLAQSLLAQAGYPNGFTIELAVRDVYRTYLPEPLSTALAIQTDLAAANITANIVVYESGDFIDNYDSGELDLFLLGWFADYNHPDNFYAFNLCGANTSIGPRDDLLCDQLAATLEEFDSASQFAIYQWASAHIHETLPLLPLAHGQTLVFKRADLAGANPSPLFYGALNDAFYATSAGYLPVIKR